MEPTNLSNSLDATEEKAHYDANVKQILANKYVLAWIMKHTTKEFGIYSIEEIKDCIEGTPEIATVPITPGLTNADMITGNSTEDAVPNEGKITFDIRFYAVTPTKEQVKIILNIEAQNKYHVGYDLVTRGIFYCARLLSSQLDREFSVKKDDKDKYDNLKKVYSIWLCVDCPKYAQNTITSYDIKPTNLYGNFNAKTRYDMMSVVMIYLGDKVNDDESSELIKMLSVLLAAEMQLEEKKQLLEHFGIPMSNDFEEEVRAMCNLSDGVMEKGIKKGLEQGIEQGIVALVDTLKEFGQTKEAISLRIMKKFGLSESEAEKYLQ